MQILDEELVGKVNWKTAFEVGDYVKAIVLDIDNDRKKISLGMKASYFPKDVSDAEDDEEDEDDDEEDEEIIARLKKNNKSVITVEAPTSTDVTMSEKKEDEEDEDEEEDEMEVVEKDDGDDDSEEDEDEDEDEENNVQQKEVETKTASKSKLQTAITAASASQSSKKSESNPKGDNWVPSSIAWNDFQFSKKVDSDEEGESSDDDDDDNDEDEKMEDDSKKKKDNKSKKKEKKEKKRKQQELEKAIDRKEVENLKKNLNKQKKKEEESDSDRDEGEDEDDEEEKDDSSPASIDDFEKLLISEPNNSLFYIKYIAYLLSIFEIEKARQVAERGLKKIHFRKENDKLNLYVAYITLEHLYGLIFFCILFHHSSSPLYSL